jgi:hypothetical protein
LRFADTYEAKGGEIQRALIGDQDAGTVLEAVRAAG